MNFSQRLRRIQRKANSLLCIGLDTDISKVPESLFAYGDPVFEFNRHIIDATKDLVCAYKINLAFYESTGEHGWYTVHQTLARIPEEIVTIGDAKRGDIGNSSEMYAKLLVDDYEFGATTVNPYMGEDSVQPFLKNSYQGAFILAVTSNPGAKDFQYLKVKGRPLYEQVIRRVKKWNRKKNCGLVVGATRPKELQRIRHLVPDMPILIPGIGAQGGDLKSAIRYGCDRHGELAVINASRSIIYASGGEDFATAARRAAIALRDEINALRGKYF
ncbi:MAG: orotidine-5'-phosphate decarboxylase [Bacteroidota bacterium]